MKTCPFCSESIDQEAAVCPHCDSDLMATASQESASTKPISNVPSGWRSRLIAYMGIVVLSGTVVFLATPLGLLLPWNKPAQAAARRTACKNNLERIGLALHQYHDQHDSFPPAYVVDDQPMHSWRVLILPFLNEQPLYDAYDFAQPWDSPANAHILRQMPTVFSCPSQSDHENSTNTGYAAVFGPDCWFQGANGVSLSGREEGADQNLAVGEITDAEIRWTEPRDINVSVRPGLNDPQGFSRRHPMGVQFVTAEGSGYSVNRDIPPKMLRKWFGRSVRNSSGKQ